MNTFETVKKIILENLSCDESDVTETANLMNDLGADSLDAVELVMALEEEFDIKIEDDSMSSFKTVADIVNFVNAQK